MKNRNIQYTKVCTSMDQRYISSKLLSVCNDFEQISWISMNYFILRVRGVPGLCCNVLYSLEPLMFTLNLNLFCVLRLFHWAPPFMDCIGYFIGHHHLWFLILNMHVQCLMVCNEIHEHRYPRKWHLNRKNMTQNLMPMHWRTWVHCSVGVILSTGFYRS